MKFFKNKGATGSRKQRLEEAWDESINEVIQRLQHLETQSAHFETQFDALRNHRPLEFPLPKFTGRQDGHTWDEFICKLYEIGNIHGWGPIQYAAYMPKCLEGEALAAYRLLPKVTRECWHDLLPELANGIRLQMTPEEARQKLAACRQNDDEAPSEFMLRIKRLAQYAFETDEEAAGSWTQGQQNQMIVTTFRSGLLPELYAEANRREVEDTPQEELKKVVAESDVLTIIRKRAQEHEAASTNDAALKALHARIAKLERRAEQMQHAAVTQFHLQEEQEAMSSAESLTSNEGGISTKRRRRPRPYRKRNVQRRRQQRGSTAEEAEAVKLCIHEDTEDEYV
ncbi:hypothetical protein AAVH_23818 [Aphelenchoides avenae]|nr:hypothetical protein AAVH_23818 [Aphelenchus avenae]